MSLPEALSHSDDSIRVIYGLDYGVRRAYLSCPQLEVYESLVLKVGKFPRYRELQLISEWITFWISPSSELWVEATVAAGSMNVRTSIEMAELKAAAMVGHQGRSFEVRPSEWKKAVCGHGGLDKPGIRAWLELHHPSLAARCDGQDLIDATCISLFGRAAGVEQASRVPG